MSELISTAEVGEYYAATWHQYRRVWSESSSYAIHYGYWDAGIRTHAQSLLEANRQLLSRTQLRPGMRVLDAGCGVGGTAMWLAKTFDVSVEGVTVSEEQVCVAESLIREAGLSGQVEISLRDFTATGFADESFDLVIAQESMCHANDKAGFLAEVARVLKPGGELAVADGFRSRRPLPPRGEQRLHGWLNCWAVPDLITPREFAQYATAAGLVNTRCEDVTPQIRRSARRMQRLAMAKMVIDAPERAWKGPQGSSYSRSNIVGGYRQSVALRHGDWIYCFATATRS